jgi:hypothetical protein
MLRRMLVTTLATCCLVFPVLAQPSRNIAGDYRGLLTGCLAATEPNICRRDLTEIVRLAVEVDMRRADWEGTHAGSDGALTAKKYSEYSLASDKLNRAIVILNRVSPRE